MSASTTNPENRSAAEIERDVERERARVEDTLGELRDRTSPGQIFEQVVDYARHSGGPEFARNLGEAVRDNPLPVLLIGAGIGWLMMSGNRSHAPRHAARPLPPLPAGPGGARSAPTHVGTAYADSPTSGRGPLITGQAAQGAGTSSGQGSVSGTVQQAGEAARSAGQRVGAAASDASHRAGDAAHRAGEAVSSAYQQATGSMSAAASSAAHQASEYGEMAREQAYHYGREAQHGMAWLMREQPLVLGAIGVALGAAVGALLPSTETEDRLMGETRDAVADRAMATAQEGYERVRDVADERLERAQAAVGGRVEEAREGMDRGDSAIGRAREAVGDAARGVREAVRDTAHDLSGEARSALGDKEKDKDARAAERQEQRHAAGGPAAGGTAVGGPAVGGPAAGAAAPPARPIVGPGAGVATGPGATPGADPTRGPGRG